MNKKTWKVLGAGGLALFMGLGTLCGVLLTPMNSPLANAGATSASNAANLAGGAQSPNRASSSAVTGSQQENLLIEPRAEDPIIYTTDYGLDIKWGATLPKGYSNVSGYGNANGNLAGFFYFSTGSYQWVIIGQSSSGTSSKSLEYLFSVWQGRNTAKYNAFKNIYETTTPAGSAISSKIGSTHVVDVLSVSPAKSSSEISSGYVLALLNNNISTLEMSWVDNWDWHQYGVAGHPLYDTCVGYASNDTFGFGSYLSHVKTTSLSQLTGYVVESSSGSRKWYSKTTNVNLKFFTLGTTSNNNFRYQTYLTNAQVATGSYQWGRDSAGYLTSTNDSNAMSHTGIDGNGAVVSTGMDGYARTWQVRPACQIQI